MRDVFICVRTTGERTEKCLLESLKREFPLASLEIVSERPFYKALEKAYQLSISSGKEWSIHFDADILLMPGASDNIKRAISSFSEKIFSAQCLVADPLLGTLRFAGNKIYKNEYIPLALSNIDNLTNTLRPERYVISLMEEKGFSFVDLNSDVIGLHDYQQFYIDIYRKCLVFSFKHLNKVHEFLPYWREQATNLDCKVARKGFADGILRCKQVQSDVGITQQIAHELNDWLKKEGMEEKRPLESISEIEMRAIVSNVSNRYFSYIKKKGHRHF